MTDKPLRGRVALVTGAGGSGMGRATAFTLARDGAKVALNFGTYRKGAASAKQTARAIEHEFGSEAVLLPADTERPAPDPKHPAVLTASGDASKAKP